MHVRKPLVFVEVLSVSTENAKQAEVISAQDSLAKIAISKIRENPVALRQVNRNTEAYLELVESIRKEGILNPIVVRPMRDPESGDEFYGLIDGLHRFTAAQDAGLTEVPAHIKSMEDAQVLVAQIIGNIHRVETRPVEYSKQLQKILAQDPLLTSASLASQLGKSTTWISDRLGLLKVDEKIAPLVDEGKINLSNAFVLAKLPKEEQLAFTDRAMTMTPQEFTATVLERKKQLDKARREGRDADTAEFVAPIHMRKLKEVRDEMERATVGPTLVTETGVSTAAAGFALGVQWALHQDPTSVAVAKQKDEDRKRSIAEKREKAQGEKAKKRAEEASVKAARLSLEAELLDKGTDAAVVKAELKKFDDANGLVEGKYPKKEVAADESEVSEG